MPRQIQGSQRDFSFGEIDVALKRADDHPARKAGLRQMANARILNSGAIQNRSGRRALFPISNSCTRIEKITMSSGNNFKIAFGNARLQIIDSTEAILLNVTTQGGGGALPWTTASLKNVVYAVFGLSIYVTFAGMRPQVLTWDGVSTWTRTDYTELVTPGGQKRTPFYRLSPKNISIQPSAVSGSVTVVADTALFTAAWVGVRIRYAGRQMLVTAYTDSQHVTATVIEPLPPSQTLTVSTTVGIFSLGDVVVGGTSGAIGIVTTSPKAQVLQMTLAVSGAFVIGDAVVGGTSGATGVVANVGVGAFGSFVTVSFCTAPQMSVGEVVTGPHGNRTVASVTAGTLIVQIIASSGIAKTFVNETIAGPSGTAITTGVATGVPQSISVWDDEVINDLRGYPASCFTDQFRVGFCNFPAIPGGIAWSAINSPTDLNVGANPDDAMFEIAPGKVQVYYVIPGPESSEFVMCDTRIYYVPISVTNPLKPGSVAFQLLSGDGAAQVQPRVSQEVILYVNAGQTDVMAIVASGAYLRPFNTKNLSDFHGHLFNAIVAIAVPNADGTFSERYAYVLNGDGTIAVGKYNPESLLTNVPVIGWGPWSGTGTVNWIASWNADVVFTSSYFGTGIYEVLDDAKYLDCAISVNAAPTAFAPPGGKGPLWFIPSQTVTLMDQVTRAMGTYVIDADGFIVPQFNGGEDLTRLTLVAGQPWTMTAEPFAQDAASGADMHQRMMRRRISNFAVYVINSTGFYFAKLFSSKQTSTSPALGTVMNTRRVPAWNIDDDATLPPKLRETVESWRPSGNTFDPRVAIIKDTPGPLLISEIAMEISI